MLRVLPIVVLLAVYIYALIDLATSPGDEVRVLPRPVWLLVILLVPVLGPVSWLVFGRPPSRPDGGDGGGGLRDRIPRPAPRPPSGYAGGPVAPDDDPDFLRKLDEHRHNDPDAPPPTA